MNNLQPQEILNALSTPYYVIDVKSRKILQTNDSAIAPGSSCYKSIFNKDASCGLTNGRCFCQQDVAVNSKFDFLLENEKDGQKSYCKVFGTKVNKDIVVINTNDISEYYQQQNEIRKKAKLLERVEKLARFGYWEIDIENELISPSAGSRIIYGISDDVISLSEVRAYTLPEYQELFGISLKGLLKQGKSFDIEYKIKRPSDNAIRHIRAIAEFGKGKNAAYGVVIDITDAVEARDALIKSEEYLSLLFKNMNSAFAQHKIVTNEQGEPVDYVFLDVNQKFEELTGLKKEQIVHKTVKEVLPNTEDHWIKRYGKVALTGEPVVFIDYFADFDKYFEVAAYSPWKDFFALSFTDVTNRKESEIALVAAKEKAIESDRLKTLFLANMSHEIRTPLNGILGFSGLLSSGSLDDEQRQYYKRIIENSGHRLMTVIDDIVNISMIQSNQLKMDYHEFDLIDLLEEIFVVYKKQNQAKLDVIDFRLSLTPNHKILLVYSDKDRVFQIIKNLLDNAFKFTQEGFIEFGLKLANTSDVQLYVKDSGIGIEKDKQNLIFETFRQVEEGQNRRFDGSGLGLAIVSGILDKLNGSVEVISEYNKGTEFCVFIPRNEDQLSKYVVEMIAPKVEEESNVEFEKTIVSFEDDSFSVEFLKTVVEMFGYKHQNFVFVQEGLKYLRKNKVDLILMDVQLPEVNGYQATKMIKAEFPEIPVIIQTAFAMAGDKEKAFRAGCDDYIPKPLTRSVLHAKINKCLEVEY